MEYKLDDADIEKEAQEVELDSTKEAEETESQDETSEQEADDTEELKLRLAKAEKALEDQKLRARKAEKKLEKTVSEKDSTKVDSGMSSKDTIAIINAKVHEDDIDDVVEYAKFKGISVAEALKSTVMKASLAEKEELRNTAQATNTGRTRPGSAKIPGETLLEKARKTGEMPDSDEGINALLEARQKKK